MPLSPAEEAALIELVRQASKTEILPRFRSLDATDIRAKSRSDDLVTVADTAAERVITEGVARILPDAQVVGEEAVSADASVLDRIEEPGRVVVIDPIDGTWNFAHGIAVFGVILAVIEAGETIFGLLYDPVFDDAVLARKGGGAWMRARSGSEQRLTLGPPGPMSEALGFVPLQLFPPELRPRIATATLNMARTHSLRCSCHEYRQLALGSSDFMLAAMLNVWDHAAGLLALGEAGGASVVSDGTAYRPGLRDGYLVAARRADAAESLRQRFFSG